MIDKAKAIAALGRSPRSESGGAFGRNHSLSADGSSAPSYRRHRRSALIFALVALATLALGVAVASATAPTVTTDDASSVSYTTAHASGTVDPTTQDTTFHFDYATQADFSDAVSTPDQGPLSAGSGSQSVSADLTGLAPNTTYHLRLVATNVDGTTAVEAPDTFTTLATTPPAVSIDPVSQITSGTAHFSGTVNPNAPGPAPQDPAFDTTWHFDCSPGCPGLSGGTIPADNSAHPVSADTSGLQPNTPYTVTLHAANLGGESTDQTTFTTQAIPPVVVTNLVIFNLFSTEATIRAIVNNENAQLSDCHFDYGPDTNYGASVPCADNPPPGLNPVTVSAHLSGLAPGTTYHYRLVATSVGGTTEGPDASFTTPNPSTPPCTNDALRKGPSADLPDCRAYEQVSPPDKSGNDIAPDSNRTRIATDGSAVTFTSFGAFGDVLGGGLWTSYLAARADGGWSTHGISPPQPPESANLTQLPQLDYHLTTADLSAGILFAPFPVTSDPDTANVANLYLRTDLRTAGPGSYQLLSACPLCAAPGGSPLPPPLPGDQGVFVRDTQPLFVGASADLSRVVFASHEKLTADAPGDCAGANIADPGLCPLKLYESRSGAVTLLGILPDGTPSSASDSPTGSAGSLSPHVVSADGSRVSFTDPTTGNLYQRVDGTTTVQINASEKTNGSAPDGTDGGGHQPATYMDASADGTRVFFTTTEALTNDTPEGNATDANKLYLYDANAPDHQHLTYIAPESTNTAGRRVELALGASADGHFFYFAAEGQWLDDQPLRSLPGAGDDHGIYLWHDGDLRLVATWSGPRSGNGTEGRKNSVGSPTVESRVSADGLHLIFTDNAGFGGRDDRGPTGYHEAQQDEIYLYSAADNSLTCASCNPSGAPATASAADIAAPFGPNSGQGLVGALQSGRPLSADGRYVFFSTAEALVPQDTNGVSDAYEFDAQTGRLHLLSQGTGPDGSFFVDATPDGSNALISTRDPLVGQDGDLGRDVYDARINGGLPSQFPATLPACTDTITCQGSGSGQPAIPGPGSPVSGPGNQGKTLSGQAARPHKKCKKHKHRCKKRSRAAGKTRRAGR